MGSSHEVVVTGLGVVSPIGIGCDAFWSSLTEQRSGVRPISRFDAGPMPVSIGAEVVDFDPKQYVKPRKALKVMCRELQTAFAASTMAAAHAGLERSSVDPMRFGSVFGGEMFYDDVNEFTDLYDACQVDGQFQFERYAEEFPNRIYPLWMLKHLPNMATCHVAIALDAQGPCNTIVSGDASGLLALVEAMRVLDRGAADVMLVGATGTRVSLTTWMYRGDSQLSHFAGSPAEASRPFDAARDGMVNGEGASAIILETAEHAARRGADPLVKIGGYASTMSTRQETSNRQRAIEKAVIRTLADSSFNGDLGHINAHGLSTVEHDQAEAAALRAVLPETPVTALKSYFGNLGPGGSMTELIGSIMSIDRDYVPATLNYQTPDPACPIHVVREPLNGCSQAAIKVSYSTTGQTAAVLIYR